MLAAMQDPAASPPHLDRWRPSVTVAAIVCDEGTPPRYLLVEEHTPEGLKFNNPAGHLEPGETPEQGVVREALEETGRAFQPEALLGVYLSRFQRPATGEDVTYLRFAYAGRVGEAQPGHRLDEGIVATHWCTLAEVQALFAQQRLRSALVLTCLQDHAAGRRLPLDAVRADASLWQPEVKAGGATPTLR
jgi:ADP-ribose pyrophosphatase YjhB (NUDIX family)